MVSDTVLKVSTEMREMKILAQNIVDYKKRAQWKKQMKMKMQVKVLSLL